jgi:hypothetical protein
MDPFFPVAWAADKLVYAALGLRRGSLAGEALNFFFFDTVKIFILLGVVIFAVSLIRTFLPPEKVRAIIAKRNPLVGHLLAASIGIITPFCSCSAVPLFLGFVQAGVPLGATFTFLVASPMINEVALALLWGMFGWQIAALYILSGLLVAVVSGLIIGRLKPQDWLEPFVLKDRMATAVPGFKMACRDRAKYARDYTKDILKKVWPYLLAGIGLGAWIHGYVPAGFLAKYAGADKWYAVPLATIVGVPLYSNAAGVIPLVRALVEKGVAIGTALAFMMAVTALSLPEFMILRRVMKPRLLAVFAGVVAVGIILTGYLFNFMI